MLEKHTKIEVFDLDGTLTYDKSDIDETCSGLSTYSYWNLITEALVGDPDEFIKRAGEWKQQITTILGIDKVVSSREMTERGIRMFIQANRSACIVRAKAEAITHKFIECGIIREFALKYLLHCLQKGVTCVVSTASYEDGAVGFVRGLVSGKLLSEELSRYIVVSGTQIDWSTQKVLHMNADTQKIVGLANALGLSLPEVKMLVYAVFGDDPQINDSSLLRDLSPYSFVIPNAKNKGSAIAPNCVFADWEEIYKARDDIHKLHEEKRL